MLTDDELVSRYREEGDEAAFREIVRRYQTPVFLLAVSLLGQGFAPDAEDVTQEVMVRIHDALPTFRGESRFGSWVYRIAFNHALNVKSRVRFRAPHVTDAALAGAAAPDPGPSDQLETAARNRALLECVAELPDVYQSALRLQYWMGASMGEIAGLLDVPENTVKSYLRRGRQLLRAMMVQRGFHE